MRKTWTDNRVRWSANRLVIAIVLIVGAALRLYKLGGDSFWLDEIDAVTAASLPLPRLVDALKFHASPPLDYLIMHVVQVFGHDETLIRLPAALAGVAALYVVYRIGRLLYGLAAGISAALLLAFSLPAIAYAQEARMYSLLILLTSLLLLMCVLLVTAPRSWWLWIATTCVAVLLVYTHYYGLVVLFVLAILWLFSVVLGRDKALLVCGAVSFAVVGGCFALWLPILLEQIALRGGATLSYALPRDIYWVTTWRFLSGGTALVASSAYLLLFLVGLAVLARNQRVLAWLLVAFTFGPLLMIYVVPQLSATVTPRNTLFALPGYLLGIAVGLAALLQWGLHRLAAWPAFTRLRSEWAWASIVGVVALVLALGPSASMLTSYWQHGWWMKDSRSQWRETAALLQQSMRPGDLVVVNNRYSRYLLSFYLDPLVVSGRSLDVFVQNPTESITGKERFVPIVALDAGTSQLRDAVAVAPNVWLLYPDEERLDAVGFDMSQVATVDSGYNIPLAHVSQPKLAERLDLSALDDNCVLAKGWSDRVYAVDQSYVH